MKGQSHLVECLHILGQCGDGPDIEISSKIGLVPEIIELMVCNL